MTSFEMLDIERNCWEMLPEMKHPRSGFRIAGVNDRIIVIGGLVANCSSDIVEMYNITNKLWMFCNLLPSPVSDIALATIMADDIEKEVLANSFQFKGDALVEKTKRILSPLSGHFGWVDK